MESSTPPVLHPLRVAITIALVYLVFCSVYIWISGEVAANSAGDVLTLKQLELEKGLLFIGITTLLFFLFSFFLLQRIATNTRQVMAQQKAMVHAERRAMAGLFAASVAHDINNILSVVELAAFKLSQGSGEGEGQELSRTLSDANQRLTDLTRRLMEVGRDSVDDEMQSTDLRALLQENIDFARSHKYLRNCELRCICERAVVAQVSRQMVGQMLLNLMLNAGRAAGDHGQIELQLHVHDNYAVLEVHDNGPGIAADERERVFDTFYTTHREGHGLGLLSVRACAEMHKGMVEVTDSPLGGACFRVSLPLRSQ
jgi:two-component system sensor histidine kinase HydH